MTLLPCAHCGGSTHLTAGMNWDSNWYAEIICEKCPASIYVQRLPSKSDCEQEAIAAWNRRAVPEGFVLVPVEPTEEMLAAGSEGWYEATMGSMIRDMYKAMIEKAQEKKNG